MLGIASACFFGLLSVLSMIYYHAAAWFFIVGLAVSLAIALWRWLTEKAHLTKQQRIWSSLSFGLSVCGLGWILMLWVPLNMATYTGVLISPKTAERQLEIGNGGTILKILDGKPGGPLFTFFDKTNLTIEAEKGKLKVSTIVYDRNGRIAVELIKNGSTQVGVDT